MERIDRINPERLRWALEDRGLSVEALAKKAGAAESTLDKVLEGEMGLTFGQLQKIGRAVGRGVLFFLDPNPVQEDKVRPASFAAGGHFRTLTNQKPELGGEVRGLIERVGRLRETYLGLLEELDEDRPQFRPPEVEGLEPKEVAERARRWLRLDDQTAHDFDSYRQAAEAAGVLVVLSSGYAGAWQIPKDSPVVGFSLYFEQCPVIAVGKARSKGRQSFTLMHELGHLLLHRSSFIDEEEDLEARRGREREANDFAGHLLVPDRLLEQVIVSGMPDRGEEIEEWFDPYRRAWGVSVEMILRRLVEAGRVRREVYDGYRSYLKEQFDQEGQKQEQGQPKRWRNREPVHLFGQPYVRTVLDAMHARQITLHKASGYLDNLKAPDLKKLEGFIARV